VNAYVLGAGVSKCAGYPVGTELFDEIDRYVRESGNLVDRFDYREGWNELRNWLETNTDPAIAQAYYTKNIEHLFTILDFAAELRNDALLSAVSAGRGTEERAARSVAFDAFDAKIKDYQRYRAILLWALEHYFAWRHDDDYVSSKKKTWDSLRAFGNILKPGDAVITFNYDATLERVLLDQGKWSPSDGFGFDLVFQKSRYDKTRVASERSPIVVLHLHGATGWYRRPAFAPDYVLPPGNGGALPLEAFGAAPIGTKISLDPQFLQGLGILNVDACLPDTLPAANERHVVLHPSFLKDYERDEQDSHVFVGLWQRAAQILREAQHTFIIGYSLPKADVAALTLLLTTLRRGTVSVVNPTGRVVMRLSHLFGGNPLGCGAVTLEEWLAAGHPTRIPWRPRERASRTRF
jgi:hypothetical protein